MGFRERGAVGFAVDGRGDGVEAVGGGLKTRSRREGVAQVFANVAQRQVGSAGGDERGISPDDDVMFVAIARVAGREGYGDVAAGGRFGEFEADVLAGRHRIDGHDPRFHVADVLELRGPPLPLRGFVGERGDVARLRRAQRTPKLSSTGDGC